MKERPLTLAIGAVIKDNKILLLKRIKPPYVGYWCMPGGKVELGEHVSEAVVREIWEETGIETSFEKHVGILSEVLKEKKEIKGHFIIHICKLVPLHEELVLKDGGEGELKWFDLSKIKEWENLLVPSDIPMVNEMVLSENKSYANSDMEKVGEEYVLKKFY